MADRIRKINSQTSDVHAVVVTGQQLPANASIWGLAVSANGTVYAADNANNVVYKVFENGTVNGSIVGSIGVAGDVPSSGMVASGGNTARLNVPVGICVDASDNIYVADSYNHKIKRLTTHGRCQTLVGTGVSGDVSGDNGLLCQLNNPTGICVDKSGIIYICDSSNNKIKKILPSGKVVVIAGNGTAGMANGIGNSAIFDTPNGITVDNSGVLYVCDTYNYRIRKIDQNGNSITLAGFTQGFVDSVGNNARFGTCYDIVIDPANNVLWVLDYSNRAIRKVLVDGRVTTFMPWKGSTIGSASSMAVDKNGFLYILEKNV